MKNKDFCFMFLILLVVMAEFTKLNIYLRISFGAIGIVMLMDLIVDIRRLINASKKEKNDNIDRG